MEVEDLLSVTSSVVPFGGLHQSGRAGPGQSGVCNRGIVFWCLHTGSKRALLHRTVSWKMSVIDSQRRPCDDCSIVHAIKLEKDILNGETHI